MPEYVKNINGGTETLYLPSEVQAMLAAGRHPASFTDPSPDWAMQQFGWIEPRVAFKYTPMRPWDKYWETYFLRPQPVAVKPGFDEIFTAGLGPLTGAEVREAELRAGVLIDDSTAVRAYNEKRSKDHELFGSILTLDDVVGNLTAEEADRLYRVDDWLTKMLEDRLAYFSFTTPKVISEDVIYIEEVRHVVATQVGAGESIGFALMGRHGLKRDVFDLTQYLGGPPNPKAEGKRAMELAGRDRAFRVIGTDALSTLLAAPHLVLASLHVSQAEEGRRILMQRSNVVPGWVWDWLK